MTSDLLQSTSGPDDTRQRLIEAALRLFSEIGYARTTTRAIAAAAGVNEVTLFRHFGSKKQLFSACVASFNTEGFAATFEQRLTGDYARDVLMMAQGQIADMVSGFELVRLLLCDAQEIPELQEIIAAGAQGNRTLIADYFRRQVAVGVVRSDLDPEALGLTFESLFSWPVFIEKVLVTGRSSEPLTGQLLAGLVAIFVRGTIQ
jgi:AcrR family transcriptional regulator